MAILPSIRKLLISHKNGGNPNDPVPFKDYGDDMRFLEIWASQPIQQLVAGANITLTPSSGLATDSRGNGPNPITISATGGGGTFYASLTGTGEFNPTGALTQTGPFNITDTTSGSTGIQMTTTHGTVLLGSTDDNATLSSGNLARVVGLGAQLLSTGVGGLAGVEATNGGSASLTSSPENNLISCAGDGSAIVTATNGKNASITGFGMVTTDSGSGTQIETSTSGLVGFMGATPIAKQFVTGSRGGNAALANLLTALAGFGLIVDNTTP